MNLLVIIFIIFMVWRIWKGFRNGFAKEVNGVISLFMALIVLSVVFVLIAGIWGKNTETIVVSVVLLVGCGIFYRILNMVMKSITTLARLPLISAADRLLGAAAGVLELMIVFWMMYIIVEGFPTGRFGEQIMAWTKESTLLMNIYSKNYIANWIVSLK